MFAAVNNTKNERKRYNLHQLIEELLIRYQPAAAGQNSSFINDVDGNIALHADKQTVATLLGSLLYLIARCSRNTCINISSKIYHTVTILHFKDPNLNNSYDIHSELQHLNLLSENIGGYVDITSQRKTETTIALSFINKADQLDKSLIGLPGLLQAS